MMWGARSGHNPSEATRTQVPSGRGPRALFESNRILIAEDVPSIAWLICDTLVEAGFGIVGPAATAGTAAEMVAEQHVDAALLDVGLADGPSFSLAESLADRGIPFAFLTGYDIDDVPSHLRDHPVITKPMQLDNLVDVVQKLCRLARTPGAPTTDA